MLDRTSSLEQRLRHVHEYQTRVGTGNPSFSEIRKSGFSPIVMNLSRVTVPEDCRTGTGQLVENVHTTTNRNSSNVKNSRSVKV